MKTPIALWLADKLEDPTNTHGYDLVKGSAAAELIRQHEVIEAQRKVLEQVREALTTASRRFELLAAHDDATHNGAKPSAGYNDCQTVITAIQEQLK